MDKQGAATTLAVFVIFVILISVTSLTTFQASRQRKISGIQQLTAIDLTRATASTIKIELDKTLETAITAAMYEAGVLGETRQWVETHVRAYLENRIDMGWFYSNLIVAVRPDNEYSLSLKWLPDGSVQASGYLNAVVQHVLGPCVYGISLDASPPPRFERIKKVAELALQQAGDELDKLEPNLPALQDDLNKNYACEGLDIELWSPDNISVSVDVTDVFGARKVILG